MQKQWAIKGERRVCCVCTGDYIRTKPWLHVCSKICLSLIKQGFDAVREYAYAHSDAYPWKELVREMEDDKRKAREYQEGLRRQQAKQILNN